MANESVLGTIKPITTPALRGRLNVWPRPGGFHHGPSAPRSPQGRIHDCNRTVLPGSDSPGHLHGESIHELLADDSVPLSLDKGAHGFNGVIKVSGGEALVVWILRMMDLMTNEIGPADLLCAC